MDKTKIKTFKYRLTVESDFFSCDVLTNKISLKYLKSIKLYNRKLINLSDFYKKG